MTTRRSDITQATRELITLDPRRTPSVREVAARVNISAGAIYGHFKDLGDVVLSVRRSLAFDLLDRMEQALSLQPDADNETRCRIAAGAIVDGMSAELELFVWSGLVERLDEHGAEPAMTAFLVREFGLDMHIADQLVDGLGSALLSLPALIRKGHSDREALTNYVIQVVLALVAVLDDCAVA